MAVSESILTSIKKMLGPEEDYTNFDPDLIMHINSVFMLLNQMGVGPVKPFVITDSTDLWSDFSTSMEEIEAVKTYIYLKVRQIFDPPSSSALLDSLDNRIKEWEWRLSVQVDPGEEATNV